MVEEWRRIEGSEEEVSNLGHFRRPTTNGYAMKKTHDSKQGVRVVIKYKPGVLGYDQYGGITQYAERSAAREMLKAFKPVEHDLSYIARPINGDHTDIRIDNWYWEKRKTCSNFDAAARKQGGTNSRPVYQLDNSGRVVAKYASLAKAAESFGDSPSKLSKAMANGKRFHEYFFKYAKRKVR